MTPYALDVGYARKSVRTKPYIGRVKMTPELPINIIIAGVGGQGNVLASRIIALTAIKKGYDAMVGETFGAAQRGGSVMSHIRIGNEELGPLIPRGEASILLGFEPIETLRVGLRYLNPRSRVIMNIRPVYPVDVLTGLSTYPKIEYVIKEVRKLCKKLWTIDATDLAKKAGNILSTNIVMIGALAGSQLTPFSSDDYLEVILKQTRRLKEANLRAFNYGLMAIKS